MFQNTSTTTEDQELTIEEDDSGDSDTEKPGNKEGGFGNEQDFEDETGVDGSKDEQLGISDDKDDLETVKDIEGESGEPEGIQDNGEGDSDEDLGITGINEGDKRTELGTKESKDLEDNTGEKDDSDSNEDDISYPDTSIDLQYKSGGKFQLQRGTSTSSSQATEDFVDLGDGEVLDLRSLGKDDGPRKQRLSAKQRRQMKKKIGLNDNNDAEKREDVATGSKPEAVKPKRDAGQSKQPIITQQNVSKRGKKSKLKKIKEKYGDQDEEDRELMMQFLGSAGAPKESKRKKGKDSKGRKGSAQSNQGERRVTKDANKSSNVKNSSNTDKTGDEQSKGGSESTSGEQALENFAGDLVQGLTQDGLNQRQETEVKVLNFHIVNIFLFHPSFLLIFSYFFKSWKRRMKQTLKRYANFISLRNKYATTQRMLQ